MGKTKHRKIKITIYIIIGILILFSVWEKYHPSNYTNTIISPLANSIMSFSPIKQLVTGSNLSDIVDKELEGTKGTYGIVIKNLKTGESYSKNSHQYFQSGSLYKLWIMATAVNQIEKGELNQDEILSEEVSKLNELFNIDSDQVELTEGEITLSVKQAMNQMITISHNYAALLLSEKVKLSNVRNFLGKNHLTESALGESPTVTANDIALFFEELYNGQLANKENTKLMIEILKQQALNDKIPKYLSENLDIAHKTGEIGFFSHDAGIIFFKNGDYIIVILSQSDLPPAANERIANISQKVFEYFNK